MKTAFIDCTKGISANVLLASIVNSGIELNQITDMLDLLDIPDFEISVGDPEFRGVKRTVLNVSVGYKTNGKGLKNVIGTIQNSSMAECIKKKCITAFKTLNENGKPIDLITFIEVTGAIVGMHLLNCDKVYASKIPFAFSDFNPDEVDYPNNILEMLKGIPVYSSDLYGKKVTTSGLTVVKSVCNEFGNFPEMVLANYGCGIYENQHGQNIECKILLGDLNKKNISNHVKVIETNIDDMNPELYDYVMTILKQAGAKDVFLTPIIMKKNRPGIKVTVLSGSADVEKLVKHIFEQTTTTGVKIYDVEKKMITSNKNIKVETKWGEIRAKVRNNINNHLVVSPEYDDCKRIALAKNIPIQNIYNEVKILASRTQSSFVLE